jgi:hypothetical protein
VGLLGHVAHKHFGCMLASAAADPANHPVEEEVGPIAAVAVEVRNSQVVERVGLDNNLRVVGNETEEDRHSNYLLAAGIVVVVVAGDSHLHTENIGQGNLRT